jgi:hypothetical protein
MRIGQEDRKKLEKTLPLCENLRVKWGKRESSRCSYGSGNVFMDRNAKFRYAPGSCIGPRLVD